MKYHLACFYVSIGGDHFECLILQDKFNVEPKENNMNEFMKNSYNLENLRKQRVCYKNTKNLSYGDSTLRD